MGRLKLGFICYFILLISLGITEAQSDVSGMTVPVGAKVADLKDKTILGLFEGCKEAVPCKTIIKNAGSDETVTKQLSIHRRNSYEETKVIWVSRKTVGSECHACTAENIYLRFKKNKKGWRLVFRDSFESGQWGSLSHSAEVLPLPNGLPFILIDSFSSGQGFSTSTTNILIEDGDTLSFIAEIKSNDNSGAYYPDNPKYRGEDVSIRLFDVHHNGLPILLVKKAIETADRTAEEITYLKFNGEAYVPLRLRKPYSGV